MARRQLRSMIRSEAVIIATAASLVAAAMPARRGANLRLLDAVVAE